MSEVYRIGAYRHHPQIEEAGGLRDDDAPAHAAKELGRFLYSAIPAVLAEHLVSKVQELTGVKDITLEEVVFAMGYNPDEEKDA